MQDSLELIEQKTGCPYCGELFTALIDLSSGSSQYIEDCEICCRPIRFQVECADSGELASLALWREDD